MEWRSLRTAVGSGGDLSEQATFSVAYNFRYTCFQNISGEKFGRAIFTVFEIGSAIFNGPPSQPEFVEICDICISAHLHFPGDWLDHRQGHPDILVRSQEKRRETAG